MLKQGEVRQIKKQQPESPRQLSRMFSVLGDVNRWQIFMLLAEYEDLCVTDLAHIVGISVPAVSQHLRTMEMSDLIRKERMGQRICYHINDDNRLVRLMLKFCQSVAKEAAAEQGLLN